MTARVLVVDDVPANVKLLETRLSAEYFDVITAMGGDEALAICERAKCDIVLLDVMMPDLDGFEVCRRLKAGVTTHHIPVIMVTALDQPSDRVKGLDAGADDFLTKPFSVGELLARLRVAQRHTQPQADSLLFQSGRLTVDLSRRAVTFDDQPVKLTPTEYALLKLLIQHAGQALTHRQILREVWGPQYVDETHYLRVYMAQLRQKLEADPTRPKMFLTEPGVGYRLAVDE
jgi:two-component system KDP operon response regulator KdpE